MSGPNRPAENYDSGYPGYAGGQMPRDPAILGSQARALARNELMKNIIISFTNFMIYAFLNMTLLTLSCNQFKLQGI